MQLWDISFPTPSENIVFDEVLLDLAARTEGEEILRFWESPNVFIVLGRTGQPDKELIIDQIKAQLERLVSVRKVVDVSREPKSVQRELALIKVKGAGDKRVEALRVSEIFRAKVIDTTTESFIFEITGASEKVDAIIDLMRPLGLVEVSRTGVLSIKRGGDGE